MVGLDGLEPSTSVLSGPRSNRLSYRPPGAWDEAKTGVPWKIIVGRADGGKGTFQVSPFLSSGAGSFAFSTLVIMGITAANHILGSPDQSRTGRDLQAAAAAS